MLAHSIFTYPFLATLEYSLMNELKPKHAEKYVTFIEKSPSDRALFPDSFVSEGLGVFPPDNYPPVYRFLISFKLGYRPVA